MTYITTKRASTNELVSFTRDGTQSFDDFITPDSPLVGTLTTYNNGLFVSRNNLYGNASGGKIAGTLGQVVGAQETYSWRTGNDQHAEFSKYTDLGRDLTGEEMRDAIYSGYDINIEPGVSGLDRIIDRKGAPRVGESDYDSDDNGHEFWTIKNVQHSALRAYHGESVQFRSTLTSGTKVEVLDWWGYPPTAGYTVAYPSDSVLTRSQRDKIANRLVKSAIPTRPYVSLTRTIGELIKDGLPSLIGAGLLTHNPFKGTANEYLNFQFGIAPVVSDLKNLGRAVKDSNNILQQYARDSGKWIHRERVIDGSTTSQMTEIVSSAAIGLTFSAKIGSPTGGQVDLVRFFDRANMKMYVNSSITRSHKFTGEFTYALPVGDDYISRFEGYAAKADHLLGLQLDADVLWDLTPFSWLLDWIVDFGTVFDNAVAFNKDNLVMRYGYFQTHDEVEQSKTVTGLRTVDGFPIRVLVPNDNSITRKYRDRANPFGFGVTTGDLTNFQWSILAALGMSKLRYQ